MDFNFKKLRSWQYSVNISTKNSGVKPLILIEP